MTTQRAEAQTPTPAKLAAWQAAADKLRHQLLNFHLCTCPEPDSKGFQGAVTSDGLPGDASDGVQIGGRENLTWTRVSRYEQFCLSNFTSAISP
jgi:hypothetical protein